MQTPSAIVIGAGLSGLSAARALVDAGWETIVVEARDRTGGRVHTVDGIDMGAHWIHGTEGNPLTNLARQMDVPIMFVGGDSSYTGGWEQLQLHMAGHQLPLEQKQTSILLMDEVQDAVDTIRRDLQRSGGADISLEQAVEQALSQRGLLPELRTHVAWHVALLSRDDWAAGPEKLSLLWWDDGYEVYGYGDSVFCHGAASLTDRLAQGLDIRLNHPVRRVEHGEEGVRVFANGEVFDAGAAIVTLPLGVLKADVVEFDPPLPKMKRRAIQRLGMGALTRVVLFYEKPFWPVNQYVFGHLSPDIGTTPTTILNVWKTHRLPVLAMLIGGERGRAIERWTESEVRNWAKTVLNDVFGLDVPAPRRIAVTHWDSDPFARGSYSYIALGSTPDDIDALAAPVGKSLLFAGEATVRTHWACLHSAYVSGLREAARLTGDTAILPSRQFTENRRWRDMMQRMNRFFNLVGKKIDPAELESRFRTLGRSKVFRDVPPSELKVLAMMFERREVAAGEILCHVGDEATCVFAVASGNIEACLPGCDRPLARFAEGDIVGEYGMFLDQRRCATLKADSAASVLTLDYRHFKHFLLAFPETIFALFEKCVHRLNAQQSKTANSCGAPKQSQQREAQLNARQRARAKAVKLRAIKARSTCSTLAGVR